MAETGNILREAPHKVVKTASYDHSLIRSSTKRIISASRKVF